MLYRLVLMLCFGLLALSVKGQSFLDEQLQYATVKETYRKNNDKLKREFEEKGLIYPANFIFIRSYKYDSKLEVWVKNKVSDTFRLFKSYDVCALSGYMGRKKRQGDLQVPEGFYYINRFQPRSAYHLSLKINYPNFSDRKNSTFNDLGGGIYIHGSCVTVGCIPITDKQIDEVYLLAVLAKDAGQSFIPVHILPVDFNNSHSVEYLRKSFVRNDSIQDFWLKLKEAYDYFNSTHRIPVILYNGSGRYVIKKGRSVTPLNKGLSTSFIGEKMMTEKL